MSGLQMFEGKEEEALPDGVDRKVVVAVRTDIQAMTDLANKIVVKDQDTFTAAAMFAAQCDARIKKVKERMKEVDDSSKESAEKAKKARSAVLELIRSLTDPFDASKRIADNKAGTWRRAEDKRLADEAEAKRKAAQKLLDDAAEEKRKADQKKLDDETAAKLAELKASGQTEKALAIELAPPVAAPVVAEVAVVEVQKVEVPKGTVYKDNWKGVLVDLEILVKAIAEGKAPLDLVEFNQTRANELARAQKEGLNYPGMIAQNVGQAAHTGK